MVCEFLYENLNFLYENLNFLYENLRFSLGKILMIFFMIFLRLKVGLGISRTNADSQWNPIYNAFHRNFCCGNETIRR